MFQIKFVEKIKTLVLYSITYFRKSCYLRDNVGKYGRAKQDTENNTVHALCMLDN
jgi:hypothetical protein